MFRWVEAGKSGFVGLGSGSLWLGMTGEVR